jgi:uridine phosphorylase
MTFPNYASKHSAASTPLVTPERFVEHLRGRGQLGDYVAPEGIILLYQAPFAQALLEREAHHALEPFPHYLYALERTAGRVAVLAFFGIGSPAVVTLVELLAALGTRRFLSFGSAGGLQLGGKVGELVVCTGAVRDEGVSHHYLSHARYARPSSALTERLVARLTEAGCGFTIGPTWTIDAPFRETVEELRHYRDEGVLSVEMEAAALFAVAEHRGFEVASAFVLSDTLSEAEWAPDFGSPEIVRGLDILVGAGIDILSEER